MYGKGNILKTDIEVTAVNAERHLLAGSGLGFLGHGSVKQSHQSPDVDDKAFMLKDFKDAKIMGI